jgi:hypothetical protein
MQEKNYVLRVATVVSINANEAMVAPMVGSGGVSFGGSLESLSRFCVDAFGRNLALIAVSIFNVLFRS